MYFRYEVPHGLYNHTSTRALQISRVMKDEATQGLGCSVGLDA